MHVYNYNVELSWDRLEGWENHMPLFTKLPLAQSKVCKRFPRVLGPVLIHSLFRHAS